MQNKQVPTDCWYDIYKFLDVRSLYNLCHVSKKISNLVLCDIKADKFQEIHDLLNPTPYFIGIIPQQNAIILDFFFNNLCMKNETCLHKLEQGRTLSDLLLTFSKNGFANNVATLLRNEHVLEELTNARSMSEYDVQPDDVAAFVNASLQTHLDVMDVIANRDGFEDKLDKDALANEITSCEMRFKKQGKKESDYIRVIDWFRVHPLFEDVSFQQQYLLCMCAVSPYALRVLANDKRIDPNEIVFGTNTVKDEVIKVILEDAEEDIVYALVDNEIYCPTMEDLISFFITWQENIPYNFSILVEKNAIDLYAINYVDTCENDVKIISRGKTNEELSLLQILCYNRYFGTLEGLIIRGAASWDVQRDMITYFCTLNKGMNHQFKHKIEGILSATQCPYAELREAMDMAKEFDVEDFVSLFEIICGNEK